MPGYLTQQHGTFWISIVSVWIISILATTVLHELGHYAADRATGGTPVLHHNYVDVSAPEGSATSVLVTAAGPIGSLVQGLLFLGLLTVAQTAKADGFTTLFLLNLAAFGFSTFFGYLLLTPFAGAGDAAKIAQALHLSLVTRIAAAVLGGILITVLARFSGSLYAQISPLTVPSFRLGLVLFAMGPWLVAAAVVILINGFGQSLILAIFPFFLGFFVFIAVMDGPSRPFIAVEPLGWQAGAAVFWIGALIPAIWLYMRLK